VAAIERGLFLLKNNRKDTYPHTGGVDQNKGKKEAKGTKIIASAQNLQQLLQTSLKAVRVSQT
jgi:hypothetical protein